MYERQLIRPSKNEFVLVYNIIGNVFSKSFYFNFNAFGRLVC